MCAVAGRGRGLRCRRLAEGKGRKQLTGLAERGVRGRGEARPEVLDRLVQVSLHMQESQTSSSAALNLFA